LRIALFAEGSFSPLTKREKQPLDVIWNEHLGKTLGLPRFHPIVPINKKHLLAMDPGNPPMSGAEERLDQLMARVLLRDPFEVAVVAWDLLPPWRRSAGLCRWKETVDLYRFLSQSIKLPEIWREKAQQRFHELSGRMMPGSRPHPPRLEPGIVLPVCMEPMFEDLLVQNEAAVKRALGVKREPKGWPRTGWSDPRERHPDLNVLAPIITALRSMRPVPEALRKVRGDMRNHKNEWGEFLLRQLLADDQARLLVLSHPLSRRLAELLAR
jgi:hypothetical protein